MYQMMNDARKIRMLINSQKNFFKQKLLAILSMTNRRSFQL